MLLTLQFKSYLKVFVLSLLFSNCIINCTGKLMKPSLPWNQQELKEEVS